MKRIVLNIVCSLFYISSFAQAVPKKVIVEHFTNSYCSICASRNPGFYNNLWQFADVLHIAYHPSAPYAACPINKHNKSENDARTNYYGVYGSTPRIVIQGNVVPPAADYTAASLFQNETGKTSSFDVKIMMQALSPGAAVIKVIIKKVDTGSSTTAYLYAAIVEDTLFYMANNGESKHYDVFRKAVWGNSVSLPANVGDSAEYSEVVNMDAAWNTSRIYSIAMLQGSDKKMIQAAGSNHFAATLGMEAIGQNSDIIIFPNPAGDVLHVSGLDKGLISIYDMIGKPVVVEKVKGPVYNMDISLLPKGTYLLKYGYEGGEHTMKLLKE